MAGRAGRRGKDAQGNVVVLITDATETRDVPTVEQMREITSGKAKMVESQFRLVHSVILHVSMSAC